MTHPGRVRGVVVAVAIALGTAGCAGVGSIAAARPGVVGGLLHGIEQDHDTETRFTGLAAHPDGTVYLGIVSDSYDEEDETRIVALLAGHRPKVVLRVKDGDNLAGVDRLESRAMAVGKGGELFVAGSTDRAFVILGLKPDGHKRVIQGPPTESSERGYGGRKVVALAADPRTGDLYLADDCSVFRASPGADFAVLAGGARYGDCNIFNNSPPPPVLQSFARISGIAVDPRNGALYVSDGRSQVFRIEGSTVTAVAGRPYSEQDPRSRGFSGDDGPATEARLNRPGRLAVDPTTGDLYICDAENQRLRKVDASGRITTAAGNGTFDGPTFNGPAAEVPVDATQVAIDGRGHLFVTAGIYGSKQDGLSYRLVTTNVGSRSSG